MGIPIQYNITHGQVFKGDWNDLVNFVPTQVTVKTGAYTLTDTDSIALCDGTFTVTLPTADSIIGKRYYVKNISTGTATVDGSGDETIDGSATIAVATLEGIHIISDGTNWFKIGVV